MGESETKADESANILTGMILKKDGIEMARIVVFGDIFIGPGDEWYFDVLDVDKLREFVETGELPLGIQHDYQIAAMDLNHDNVIDQEDYDLIIEEQDTCESLISQDAYASDLLKLIEELEK